MPDNVYLWICLRRWNTEFYLHPAVTISTSSGLMVVVKLLQCPSDDNVHEACETPLFVTATWEHREMEEEVKGQLLSLYISHLPWAVFSGSVMKWRQLSHPQGKMYKAARRRYLFLFLETANPLKGS
ncbi:hypothetical protein EYF80_002257 [Liparis tanakae]|uniref:Uncharacterized protein n=1 Tax=Liparis tanakae TaxID=230148 RepID=A0A4Z2JBM4_9TELE|nr:hypothetical protein EYF80_002257 [Liparis tanakae]